MCDDPGGARTASDALRSSWLRQVLTPGESGPVGVVEACIVIHKPAKEPNDLASFFVDRANAGDLEGIVALFEEDAIMTGLDGRTSPATMPSARSTPRSWRAVRSSALGNQQPAMINGDVALTSTWFDDGGAAAEMARRQPDGTWLWLIDKGQIGG
jgi:hypothetical protein